MDRAFLSELRGQLGNLSQNRISVSDFRQWFMSAWWDAESEVSDPVFRLGARIENLVYILDSEEWSERSFREAVLEESSKLLEADSRSASDSKGDLRSINSSSVPLFVTSRSYDLMMGMSSA